VQSNSEMRFIREKLIDTASEVLLRLFMEPKAKVYCPWDCYITGICI